jgi:Mrp family chromosome partitioning ATPase
MDQFEQAIKLAKGTDAAPQSLGQTPFPGQGRPIGSSHSQGEARIENVPLKAKHLESMRIVSNNKDDPRARTFDMLRTQVLQTMDDGGWQVLAVTSPTAGCGKTVAACNLALSIARLPERSVLLIDLDLRKPKVAEYLGIKRDVGVLSVLQGRQSLTDALVQAGIEREQFLVLPGEETSASSEWMGSPAMGTLVQTLRREFRSRIIILDLPPVLAGDDVISLLPQLQSVLLVTAAGSSTVSDIKECSKHLRATPIVRVVVNKITEREPTAPYHAYY